jgi:hypothetical protein
MYNPNGINQLDQYLHSNYSNQIQPSYGISSSQSTGNICGDEYPSSSWNQYALANLGNSSNQTNYDPNIYYAPYYPNLFAQQYYQQQQQQLLNQSLAQIPIEQTISPNSFPASSNGGLDKNYQHLSR